MWIVLWVFIEGIRGGYILAGDFVLGSIVIARNKEHC